MKSSEEIVAYIAERIGFIFYHPRPLMYGGTAEGVELVLWSYHDIWSAIVERRDEFLSVLQSVSGEADCPAAGFPTRYLMDHPQASQEEIAEFVTKQWRFVSDRLGVPVPHERLIREFGDFKARIAANGD